MTDQYIRKAVELAGWSNSEKGYLFPLGSHGVPLNWKYIPKVVKDALAAQLVRQVDATGTHSVDTCTDQVYVWHEDDGIVNDAMCDGPDRTMNTIKAIVDSGVLDREEQ